VLVCLFKNALSQECEYSYFYMPCYYYKFYSLTSNNLYEYDNPTIVDGECNCGYIGGYNENCYPSVFGCNICYGQIGSNNIANEYKRNYYSCQNNEYSNGNYEIRVVALDATLSDKINVELVYCGSLNITESKPIKLILLNRYNVQWNVFTNDEFVLNELEFEGIYSISSQSLSSINVSSNLGNIKTNNSFSIVTGYGDDSGRYYRRYGRTARFLYEAPVKYRDFVYTFLGSELYSINTISICVGRDDDIGNISYNIGLTQQYTPSPTPVTLSPTSTPKPKRYKHLSETAQIVTFALIIIVSIMIVIILRMFVCKRNNNARFDQNIAVQA